MWAAAPLGMLAVMASAFGPEGMTLCVGQAALSVLMLEAANYVQHYGLQRTKLESGRSVYCQHTVNILFAHCQHTVCTLSAYCQHTVRTLSAYCLHTVSILCAQCQHTVAVTVG